MKKVFTFYNNCRYDDDPDCSDQYLFLGSGAYFLEVWGASGGYSLVENVARGGYSSGILSLSERTKIYVYVGAAGEKITGFKEESKNPYNGGGRCKTGGNSLSVCSSGGGSTDIRIGSNSNKKRVIVAGAGGGGAYSISCESETPGGAGGGISGKNGETICKGNGGKGGGLSTQSFFYGGNAIKTDGCGGGGGFFGGEAGYSYLNGGGGGSGYAFYDETYDYSLKIGIILEKKYFLKNTTVLSGIDYIPSYNQNHIQKGNFGNEYARITTLQVNTGQNNGKITCCIKLLFLNICIPNKYN